MGEHKMAAIIIKEHVIKDGTRTIYGKLYFPSDGEKHPMVIIGHGYNGSHLDWAKECEYFAEHGIISYAYDFCGGSGRSKSSGKTSDMTLLSEKSDVLTVFREASAFSTALSGEIFLMGGSMGGFATALAAEELGEKAAGMILYFPAFCIPENWKKAYPVEVKIPEKVEFWEMEIGCEFIKTAREIDTFSIIGSFPKPFIIFHGSKDETVPIDYSKKAEQKYKHVSLVTLQGEEHGFSASGGEKAMQQALDFMKKGTIIK